jgi:HD superfamily phosphohydrolase
VFPSASHNRLEHSLGTAHLAKKFITKLKHNHPDQEITDEVVRSLTIASLTHNIGHPPFSYAFNDFVRDGLGIKNWSHEIVSTQLMENIIDFNHIDVSREEINLSKEIILGKKNYFGDSGN